MIGWRDELRGLLWAAKMTTLILVFSVAVVAFVIGAVSTILWAFSG